MKLPQLHVRDLFWLVLVAALVAGWWIDNFRRPMRRVAIRQPVVDVGIVDAGTESTCIFNIDNVGRVPLRCMARAASCPLNIVDDELSIPPGCSGTLRVRWNARPSTATYAGKVELLTDDPHQPSLTLVVTGVVR